MPNATVDLNRLSTHWRGALDAAQDAVLASASSPTQILRRDQVQAYRKHLVLERETVASLLDAAARDEHVKLLRRLTAPPVSREQLGVPNDTLACIFDLDGVLTASADLHAAAWADTFDAFLSKRLERGSVHFAHYARFSRRTDYEENIHGKPRLDGVRAFLASRGITLPEGDPRDPPAAETVHGLANRKNEALRRRLERQGVSAFGGAHLYLEAAHDAGVRCAVVSASANTGAILERAGLADLIDARVDGNTIRSGPLRWKPAPDTLLAACDRLGVEPRRAVVFETTRAGVAAGRAARFGLVVGVDRLDGAEALRAAGADVIVTDLAELLDDELR